MNPSEERRRTVRQPLHRRALISGEDGVLKLGRVCDASAGGLGLETTAPLRVGEELEIEIHPPTGAWVGGVRFQGRVVRAASGAAGVRLLPSRGARSFEVPHLRVAERVEPVWRPSPGTAAQTPTVTVIRKRKPIWPWLLPVAAAALLLLLVQTSEWPVQGNSPLQGTTAALAVDAAPVAQAAAAPEVPERSQPAAREDVPALSSPTPPSAPETRRPLSPVPPLPLDSFKRVEGPVEQLRLAATVKSPDAPVAPMDNLPWIYAQSDKEGAQAALVPEADWQKMKKKAGKPVADDSEVHVAVNKREHRLVLYHNGVPLRTFDVGLGRNDSTPEGEFRIAVKATNPAWKHDGRIIPGGSPENRLGKRWMGLAREDDITSYGLHPAKNTRVIGGNTSFGCIQLYPEDAETLFRFCPIGTRVTISA